MANYMDFSNEEKYEIIPFDIGNNFSSAYFTKEKEENITSLVTVVNNGMIYVTDDLPVGTLCWFHNKKKEIRYDMACFLPCASIQINPSINVNAIYVKECSFGVRLGKFYISTILGNIWHIDQSNGPINLQKFVDSKKNKSGKVSCWVTPIGEGEGWKVVPCLDGPNIKSSSSIFEELKNIKAELYGDKYFGVVIFPGKIAIETFFVDCPYEFEIGSTHMCEIKRIKLNNFASGMILLNSTPIKLDPKFVDIFVTYDANVLIRTVVGPIMIPKLLRQKSQMVHNPFKENSDEDVPRFNLTQNPLFGDLYVSRNIVWSADSTSVIFCHLAKCHTVKDKSVDPKFIHICAAELRCCILAIHDGNTMWRLPNLPKTAFECVNALIENGMKLKPGCADKHLNEDGEYSRPDLSPNGYLANVGIFNIKYAKAAENYCPKKENQALQNSKGKDGYVVYHSHQEDRRDNRNLWKTKSERKD